MLEYVRAKEADYAVVFAWVEKELERLATVRPGHHKLVSRLQGKLKETKVLQEKLRAILQINNSRLTRRALPVIHDLEFQNILITWYYLPALQRESGADLAVGNVLSSAAARCGMTWIEDLSVRLDGALAHIAMSPEIPLFVAPPQIASSWLEIPGIYHEFGHNVVRKFPTILKELAAEAHDFFESLRQNTGLISPAQKIERDRVINGARNYWNEERLNELFSDIFATFVCGPAHYISCVDLGFRAKDNPFEVDLTDVHPPLAARVYACECVLDRAARDEQLVKVAKTCWQTHEAGRSGNALYDLFCDRILVERLVEAATRCIQTLLPDTKKYKCLTLARENQQAIPSDDFFEHTLNVAAMILFTKTEHYRDWEEQTRMPVFSAGE